MRGAGPAALLALLLALLLAGAPGTAAAQSDLALVPWPRSVERDSG